MTKSTIVGLFAFLYAAIVLWGWIAVANIDQTSLMPASIVAGFMVTVFALAFTGMYCCLEQPFE